MSTEELPADLDKLKITPKHNYVLLRDRNPFYCPNTASSAVGNTESTQNTKQIMHCKTRRIRRRSESNLDDFNNKAVDTVLTADNCEIVNPLRCLAGVHKIHLKRGNIAASKRNLLREPILRIMNENLNTKYIFGTRIRRMNSLNLDEKKRIQFQRPRTNISIKSSLNGVSSFRDLISECNILLNESKAKKGILENTWHLSKNFMTLQKDAAEVHNTTASNREYIEDGQAINFREQRQTASARLSCSQEASNSTSNSRNCDDVTIGELASYFDTMVHIPKKMSTMAEMMYI